MPGSGNRGRAETASWIPMHHGRAEIAALSAVLVLHCSVPRSLRTPCRWPDPGAPESEICQVFGFFILFS